MSAWHQFWDALVANSPAYAGAVVIVLVWRCAFMWRAKRAHVVSGTSVWKVPRTASGILNLLLLYVLAIAGMYRARAAFGAWTIALVSLGVFLFTIVVRMAPAMRRAFSLPDANAAEFRAVIMAPVMNASVPVMVWAEVTQACVVAAAIVLSF